MASWTGQVGVSRGRNLRNSAATQAREAGVLMYTHPSELFFTRFAICAVANSPEVNRKVRQGRKEKSKFPDAMIRGLPKVMDFGAEPGNARQSYLS